MYATTFCLYIYTDFQFSSVSQSCLTLRPHEPQRGRPLTGFSENIHSYIVIRSQRCITDLFCLFLEEQSGQSILMRYAFQRLGALGFS